MLSIENLYFAHKNFQLEIPHFQIKTGNYALVFGPSGAGKSTFLKLICGLLKKEKGKIFLNQKEIGNWPAGARNIAYVAQESHLFPTMSVYENIYFPLKVRKISKSKAAAHINRLCDSLGISELKNKLPGELSGGEERRTAFARALIFQADLLCLDEPFSALDPLKRTEAFSLLETVRKNHNCTVLHISHAPENFRRFADSEHEIRTGKIYLF